MDRYDKKALKVKANVQNAFIVRDTFWTHVFNTVDNLPGADLQNIDMRSTSAKNVLLIFADLKNKKQINQKFKGAVRC